MSLQEIEKAIAELPREERIALTRRLQARFEEDWDFQIESDVQAGRLDRLAEEALVDYRAGDVRSMPTDSSQG